LHHTGCCGSRFGGSQIKKNHQLKPGAKQLNSRRAGTPENAATSDILSPANLATPRLFFIFSLDTCIGTGVQQSDVFFGRKSLEFVYYGRIFNCRKV
jgi:hypothetical protein